MQIIQGVVSNLHTQISHETTGEILENDIDKNIDDDDLIIDYDFDIDNKKFYGYAYGYELFLKNGDEVIIAVKKNNYIEYIINLTQNGEYLPLEDCTGNYFTLKEVLFYFLGFILSACGVILGHKNTWWLIVPSLFAVLTCVGYHDYRKRTAVIGKMNKMADLSKKAKK